MLSAFIAYTSLTNTFLCIALSYSYLSGRIYNLYSRLFYCATFAKSIQHVYGVSLNLYNMFVYIYQTTSQSQIFYYKNTSATSNI